MATDAGLKWGMIHRGITISAQDPKLCNDLCMSLSPTSEAPISQSYLPRFVSLSFQAPSTSAFRILFKNSSNSKVREISNEKKIRVKKWKVLAKFSQPGRWSLRSQVVVFTWALFKKTTSKLHLERLLLSWPER